MKPIPRPYRIVTFIWLAWLLVLLGFQYLADARLDPKRPDFVLEWTPSETAADSMKDRPYLRETFMNANVAWDSEYYLSIAVGGYNDPKMRAIAPDYSYEDRKIGLQSEHPDWISMNYAFFPAYPYLMKVLALPLRLFGMNPIAAATLAGVLISALGTLLAMLSLYTLAFDDLEENGALRAVFYLVIFPTGFFLAQVYTEGLFVGLALASLVMMRRRQWLWASLLATLVIFTRPNGLAILLPLYWSMGYGFWKVQSVSENPGEMADPFKEIRGFLWGLIPLAAFIAWRISPAGEAFSLVQSHFFGSAPLDLGSSIWAWGDAFQKLFGENAQTRFYYAIEFGAIGLGLASAVVYFRRQTALSLLGIGIMAIALTSGQPLSLHRYVLAVPTLFLLLGRWGKNPVFDRAWTVFSLLLLGLLSMVFTFNFFAG